jgi:hypothetical protein
MSHEEQLCHLTGFPTEHPPQVHAGNAAEPDEITDEDGVSTALILIGDPAAPSGTGVAPWKRGRRVSGIRNHYRGDGGIISRAECRRSFASLSMTVLCRAHWLDAGVVLKRIDEAGVGNVTGYSKGLSEPTARLGTCTVKVATTFRPVTVIWASPGARPSMYIVLELSRHCGQSLV